MLIIICRCWPLIHPFTYLFCKHVRAHLDGLWNLKQRGKIPFFYDEHQQQGWTGKKDHAHTRVHTGTCRERNIKKRKHTHTQASSHACILFFLLLALLFPPGCFRVSQMCHQTLVSIWTGGEKKEILDRKVYKKEATLNFWHPLHSCFKMSRMERQGKTNSKMCFLLFTCCLFPPLSSFRGDGGHSSLILV